MPIKANNESYRPQYCDSSGCIPKEVFELLPPYPSNFRDIWFAVRYGLISKLENFSTEYPDEYYWKQPEFYDTTFRDQCMQYYTYLKWGQKQKVRFNIAGSGPYPGDVIVRNVTKGEEVEVITFWHDGCAVAKYQLFKLIPEYPKTVKARLGDLVINQDPLIAQKCFEVTIEPQHLLLEPNFPQFMYNWTQKVKAKIRVKNSCPSGWYAISIIPSEPDQHLREELLKKLGLKLTGIVAGGAWQVFIQVI